MRQVAVHREQQTVIGRAVTSDPWLEQRRQRRRETYEAVDERDAAQRLRQAAEQQMP